MYNFFRRWHRLNENDGNLKVAFTLLPIGNTTLPCLRNLLREHTTFHVITEINPKRVSIRKT